MAENRLLESLISRDALVDEIMADLSIAEMKNSRIKAYTLRRVLQIIDEQEEYGKVNPTAFVFFGGSHGT